MDEWATGSLKIVQLIIVVIGILIWQTRPPLQYPVISIERLILLDLLFGTICQYVLVLDSSLESNTAFGWKSCLKCGLQYMMPSCDEYESTLKQRKPFNIYHLNYGWRWIEYSLELFIALYTPEAGLVKHRFDRFDLFHVVHVFATYLAYRVSPINGLNRKEQDYNKNFITGQHLPVHKLCIHH